MNNCANLTTSLKKTTLNNSWGIIIGSLIVVISKAAVKGFLSKFIFLCGTLHTRLSPGEIQDEYCVVSAVVAVLSFSWLVRHIHVCLSSILPAILSLMLLFLRELFVRGKPRHGSLRRPTSTSIFRKLRRLLVSFRVTCLSVIFSRVFHSCSGATQHLTIKNLNMFFKRS